MEVKVLGTVSPRCYENKNCPGYLIVDKDNLILLDCGNGVSKYLKSSDMNKLTIIISHLHHDHYGDLLSLAYDSYVLHNIQILKKKIPVYIPKADLEKNVEDSLNTYNFLTNLGKENFLEFKFYDENDKLNINGIKIDFVRNPHQIPTYSIRVKQEKQTVVYSGDTGYKDNTITKFSEKADLLICEATFLKEQTKKNDWHLYAYEAAKIAKKADVSKLLLTHFYPEIDKSLYVKEAKEIFENTTAAEEGKVITLGGVK